MFTVQFGSQNCLICLVQLIIRMYIYHKLINALSAHMIHINLNLIFYTHVECSPTKTIYIKYYMKHTHTHTLNPYTLQLCKGWLFCKGCWWFFMFYCLGVSLCVGVAVACWPFVTNKANLTLRFVQSTRNSKGFGIKTNLHKHLMLV